jgi:hypothetical protein
MVESDFTFPQPSLSRPVVSVEDIAFVPHQGLTFQPGDRDHELDDTHVGHSYVSHVMFTGGKRVLVDVLYRLPADEPMPPGPDILSFLN